MARSFIDPSLVALATEPAAPPWNWNPGATFVQAFNDAQANQRAQEKAELDNWMQRTLFPLKQQQAALELEKLQMEVERQGMTNQLYQKALRKAHSGQMQGLRDIDRNLSGGNQNATPRGQGLFNQLSTQANNSAPLPEADEDMAASDFVTLE